MRKDLMILFIEYEYREDLDRLIDRTRNKPFQKELPFSICFDIIKLSDTRAVFLGTNENGAVKESIGRMSNMKSKIVKYNEVYLCPSDGWDGVNIPNSCVGYTKGKVKYKETDIGREKGRLITDVSGGVEIKLHNWISRDWTPLDFETILDTIFNETDKQGFETFLSIYFEYVLKEPKPNYNDLEELTKYVADKYYNIIFNSIRKDCQ